MKEKLEFPDKSQASERSLRNYGLWLEGQIARYGGEKPVLTESLNLNTSVGVLERHLDSLSKIIPEEEGPVLLDNLKTILTEKPRGIGDFELRYAEPKKVEAENPVIEKETVEEKASPRMVNVGGKRMTAKEYAQKKFDPREKIIHTFWPVVAGGYLFLANVVWNVTSTGVPSNFEQMMKDPLTLASSLALFTGLLVTYARTGKA